MAGDSLIPKFPHLMQPFNHQAGNTLTSASFLALQRKTSGLVNAINGSRWSWTFQGPGLAPWIKGLNSTSQTIFEAPELDRASSGSFESDFELPFMTQPPMNRLLVFIRFASTHNYRLKFRVRTDKLTDTGAAADGSNISAPITPVKSAYYVGEWKFEKSLFWGDVLITHNEHDRRILNADKVIKIQPHCALADTASYAQNAAANIYIQQVIAIEQYAPIEDAD